MMTTKQAKELRIGDRVTVRAWNVNSGIATHGRIAAIDQPGREFGVRIDRNRFATVFNNEIEQRNDN